MPNNYAGNPASFPTNVRLPSDGENRNAVAIDTALEDLADRTANLYAALTGTSGAKISGNPMLSGYLNIDTAVPSGIKWRTLVAADADFTIGSDIYDFILFVPPAADRNVVIATSVPVGREIFFGAYAPLTTADWSHTWNIYHDSVSPSNFLCALQLGAMFSLSGAWLQSLGAGWVVRQPVYNRWTPPVLQLNDADQVIPIGAPIVSVVPSFSGTPALDRTWTLPTSGVKAGSILLAGPRKGSAAWTKRITLANSLGLNGLSVKLTNSPSNIDDMQGAILAFDAGGGGVWRVITHTGNLP